MFFIFMAVYGTPVLSIIFCLNLALIIDKSRNDKDFTLNVYLMTGAFTIMISCITIALLTVLDGVWLYFLNFHRCFLYFNQKL